MSDTAEPFISRWSRLKQGGEEDLLEEPTADALSVVPAEEDEAPLLTDADMPALESLGDDDDYSGFLNAGVSDDLRRKALSRLFRSSKFNITDGLDDYAEDFTSFAPLGDIITADMKHHLERLLANKESAGQAEEPLDDAPDEPAARPEEAAPEADAVTRRPDGDSLSAMPQNPETEEDDAELK